MSSFDPQYQNNHLNGKIVVALERISEAFKVLLWKEGKENSLTPIQLQLLLFIKYHDQKTCKVNYLAREFNLTKATISETVRLLAKKGYIRKETDPEDTRSYSIYLTQSGNALALECSNFASALEQPVELLSNSKKEALFASLLQLITQLNKAGIISVQRMCSSCRFYQKGAHKDYCNFLEKELLKPDLRLDCPEHEILV